MKGNIAVITLMVSLALLLTFVIIIGLQSKSGWRQRGRSMDALLALDGIKLRNTPKSGLLTGAIDKFECLSKLNVDTKRKLMRFRDDRCFSFPLNNEKTGDADVVFDFCTPFMTKYVIAKSTTECGQDGYWVYDPRGCMRQFTPMKNEKRLKEFMKRPAIGFSNSTPLDKYDLRLVFFSDTCEVDEQQQELLCGMTKKGQSLAYRLTPSLIPFGPYEGKFESIACHDP